MPAVKVWYLCIYLFLWWGYCGYFLYLFRRSSSHRVRSFSGGTGKSDQREFPRITLLIPCYNEAALIEEKLANTEQLQYPEEKLYVVFLDGGSTDGTREIIRQAIGKSSKKIKIVETQCRGKIPQLNVIIPLLDSDIIVNSDVDGVLPEDSLLCFGKEFQDQSVGVVGALVSPVNALSEEQRHWEVQNKIRILESRLFSSSIVIAACYAFRRGLIDVFPASVIADDIYLPLQACSSGYRTVYTEKVLVWEKRSPLTLREMFYHKLRKSNAYLKELLRFIGQVLKMKNGCRLVYLTKFLQMAIFPWLLIVFSVLTGKLLYRGYHVTVAVFLVLGMTSLIVTHCFLERVVLPAQTTEKGRRGINMSLRVFLFSNLILLLSGLFFPFFRQTSNYRKVN